MLSQLEEFLQGLYPQGSTAALIVDEAHLLSSELLEEVRLLNNLENAQQKFLQILLVGQPGLIAAWNRPELPAVETENHVTLPVGNPLAKRMLETISPNVCKWRARGTMPHASFLPLRSPRILCVMVSAVNSARH